jgi:hypothetical protein
MPHPTITEKYGTLTCRGLPPDTVFGIPAPTSWLPMIGADDLLADPGWFAPGFLENARSLGIYPLEPAPQAPEMTP